jgi:predicted PurR-regulated permease PerM
VESLFSKVANYVPQKYRSVIFPLAHEVDDLLSTIYLRGQLMVMFVLSTFYTTGLYLIGVKSALALGTFTWFSSIYSLRGIYE